MDGDRPCLFPALRVSLVSKTHSHPCFENSARELLVCELARAGASVLFRCFELASAFRTRSCFRPALPLPLLLSSSLPASLLSSPFPLALLLALTSTRTFVFPRLALTTLSPSHLSARLQSSKLTPHEAGGRRGGGRRVGEGRREGGRRGGRSVRPSKTVPLRDCTPPRVCPSESVPLRDCTPPRVCPCETVPLRDCASETVPLRERAPPRLCPSETVPFRDCAPPRVCRLHFLLARGGAGWGWGRS